MDQIYTPADLCRKVVFSVAASQPELVADFTAGGGELLKAALNRWGSAKAVATDIDKVVVAKLRKQKPSWTVGTCDFLSSRSRQRCEALRGLAGKISVVLLNPPFSYRGGKAWTVSFAGCTFRCSKAMAVVVSSIYYLRKGGEIAAILPAGSLCSARDAMAWYVLRRIFNVEIVCNNHHRTFAGCVAKTVIVRLTPGSTCSSILKRENRMSGPTLTLYRGKIPIHELPKRKPKSNIPVVHSTSLRGSALELGGYFAKLTSGQHLLGPMLLIPRVGQPSSSKVVLVDCKSPVVLSDCVFALKASMPTLRRVLSNIKDGWQKMAVLYQGTGAPYISAADLSTTIGRFGFNVQAANGTSRSHQLVRSVNLKPIVLTPDEDRVLKGEAARLSGR